MQTIRCPRRPIVSGVGSFAQCLQTTHTMYLTDVGLIYTLVTQIVWSLLCCIAGAQNRVLCIYNYDRLIDLDEKSADPTKDKRARASHRNRTQTSMMCTQYAVIGIDIVHKCIISPQCLANIRPFVALQILIELQLQSKGRH